MDTNTDIGASRFFFFLYIYIHFWVKIITTIITNYSHGTFQKKNVASFCTVTQNKKIYIFINSRTDGRTDGRTDRQSNIISNGIKFLFSFLTLQRHFNLCKLFVLVSEILALGVLGIEFR